MSHGVMTDVSCRGKVMFALALHCEGYHIPANNTVLARAHSDTLSLALVWLHQCQKGSYSPL
eukprot:1136575-Amphidinium_carterae.1